LGSNRPVFDWLDSQTESFETIRITSAKSSAKGKDSFKPFYSLIRSFEMTEKEMITKVVIETLAPLGVIRIAFFGSFVRQDFNPQSDIDILVWLPSLGKRKTIGLRWFSLDQEIEKKIGRTVDIVTESSLNKFLREQIKKDIEIIYEKAG